MSTALCSFPSYYKIIAVDLSKQQVLDVDLKVIQQIDFTGNLHRVGITIMFFHYVRCKKNLFRFFTRNCSSIVNLFCFNIILV